MEHISLGDRIFQVTSAVMTRGERAWSLEIETADEEIDGECWAPSLYHQGLNLNVQAFNDLQGKEIMWQSSADPHYAHPEVGILYVFGHHETRNCRISFGRISDDKIELKWDGISDVLWDDEFGESVPFTCLCLVRLW